MVNGIIGKKLGITQLFDPDGTMTPLNQLAHIAIPEARQILVKPFDPSIIKQIERAILTSDIGLTPASDGKRRRVGDRAPLSANIKCARLTLQAAFAPRPWRP